MSDYAIDTAARFGEIPFVEFTKELVTGVFDSLVEAHILQMEEYSTFVNSLTQDLSAYINNTAGDVAFEDIAEFVQNYDLPAVDDETWGTLLEALQSPTAGTTSPDMAANADNSTWWSSLISNLSPAVEGLVDKINDPNLEKELAAISDYNKGILDTVPSYKQIHDAVASLIVSNKYGLLQTMAKQGLMRLVVSDGLIETKMTFSTWNSTSRGYETTYKRKNKYKEKQKKKGGILGIFKSKKKTKNRIVTVNTAKTYHRDSSGTKVDIFGRVLINFKTDYAPLNG